VSAADVETRLCDAVAARIREGGFTLPIRSASTREPTGWVITVIRPGRGCPFWSNEVLSALEQIIEGHFPGGRIRSSTNAKIRFQWVER
jgi:hypothetical protein